MQLSAEETRCFLLQSLRTAVLKQYCKILDHSLSSITTSLVRENDGEEERREEKWIV